jgi:hypothetical protein
MDQAEIHTFLYQGYKVTIDKFRVKIEAPKELQGEIYRRLQAEGFVPEDLEGPQGTMVEK